MTDWRKKYDDLIAAIEWDKVDAAAINELLKERDAEIERLYAIIGRQQAELELLRRETL